MKKAFRKMACFTSAILILFATLTACTGKENTGTTASSTASSEQTSTAVTQVPSEYASVYPLKTNVKLRYWCEMNQNVGARYANMGDTPFAKELVKRTGIEVEYIHSTTSESFSLMVASNDLPDIIEYWWNSYPGGMTKALEDKVIIAMNDIMDEYAPNYTKWLKDHPDIARQIRWNKGQYVGFPFVNGDGSNMDIAYGPLIRKDLLDKLGLEIPETVDEWYNALRGIKSLGVPSPFTKADGYKEDFIARAYGVQLGDAIWYLEDGKVVFGGVQPALKDFLATWSKWYAEGLIDKDFLTVDGNIETAKMVDGSAAASCNYVSRIYNYNNAAKDKIEGYKIVGAPYPVLKKGDTYNYPYVWNPFESTDVVAAITGTCKNPEIAARFLDYLWGEEGNMLANWGIPDVTYTINNKGEPQHTDFVLKNPEGWTAFQVRGGYMRSYSSGPYVQDTRIGRQTYMIPEQFEAVDIWSKNVSTKHLLPPISRTSEEDAEFSSIASEVNTYYKESVIKFILGIKNLDEFDKYVAQMKKMKVDRLIEIQQDAYNRFFSK